MAKFTLNRLFQYLSHLKIPKKRKSCLHLLTQEFMSQLTGNTAANLPAPIMVPQQQQQPLQQQQQQQTYQQPQPVQQQQQQPKHQFNGQNVVRPQTPVKSKTPTPAHVKAMNASQYNSPQPLYSQVLK